MIKVIKPGIYTTIQDLGRFGFSHIGVPVSGAMDTNAFKLANAILQNEENAAVIEITFGNCEFEFSKSTYICITGADFSATLNGITVSLNSKIYTEKGSTLTFGKRIFGARTYLAISGGIEIATVLKSKSFYKGITKQTHIKKGDTLPIKSNVKRKTISNAKVKFDYSLYDKTDIECFQGPEFSLLSIKQQQELLTKIFTISSNNSRMGYILNEPLINNIPSMLSSGVLPGTVQLTPSGKLIILMRDCQVTGGYPRVLQLTDEVINIIAQKVTGEEVRFKIKMPLC
ncbi:5-oxoprolinase subunit C family protein [Tenacibaculum amylolyticum]|uniref:5-oxoprolinase subunit C family protein n=1 Tax=Tenacibaculum amylolyticum TaxID=104269 RepID=UPI003895BFE8